MRGRRVYAPVQNEQTSSIQALPPTGPPPPCPFRTCQNPARRRNSANPLPPPPLIRALHSFPILLSFSNFEGYKRCFEWGQGQIGSSRAEQGIRCYNRALLCSTSAPLWDVSSGHRDALAKVELSKGTREQGNKGTIVRPYTPAAHPHTILPNIKSLRLPFSEYLGGMAPY